MYQADSHIQGLESCAKTQQCLIAVFQNVVTFLCDVNSHTDLAETDGFAVCTNRDPGTGATIKKKPQGYGHLVLP